MNTDEPQEEKPAQTTESQAEKPDQPAEPQEEKTARPAEPQAEELAQPCSEFTPLTLESILENFNTFKSLCDSLDPAIDSLLAISKLGFDLNRVILKEGAICRVLQAGSGLEEANKMLSNAESVKKGAENRMALAAKALAE